MKKLTKHIAVLLSFALMFTMTVPMGNPQPALAAITPQTAIAPAANAAVAEPVNSVGTAAGTDPFSTVAPVGGYRTSAAVNTSQRTPSVVNQPASIIQTNSLALMGDASLGLEPLVEEALAIEVGELERELRLQPDITSAEKEAAIAGLREEIEARILDEQKTDRFIVKYKTDHESAFQQKTDAINQNILVEGVDTDVLGLEQDIELITLPEKVNPAEYAAELGIIGADADIEYIQPDYKLEFAVLDGMADQGSLDQLKNDPYVETQIPDEAPGTPEETAGDDLAETPEAASGQAPENMVVVAVIDSGVDITHPDLAGKFWSGEVYGNDDDTLLYGWNFIDDNADVYDETRELDQAHGTHIAGIIAGLSDADIALSDDTVRLMVLKAFEGGSAYTSDIIEAMKKVARILSKIPFYDLKKLPQNVQAAFQRYDAHGWKGTPPGQSRNINAGGNYYNKDNYLPQVDKSGNPITYREFDVNTKDPVTGRDVERFVVGSDGSVYYTDSHYGRGASLRGLPPFVRIK